MNVVKKAADRTQTRGIGIFKLRGNALKTVCNAVECIDRLESFVAFIVYNCRKAVAQETLHAVYFRYGKVYNYLTRSINSDLRHSLCKSFLTEK